jgi:hypothetical protein
LQDRFQQLNIRLAHLLHHDTASLLELAAAAHEEDDEGNSAAAGGSAASQLLPDALLWRQHQQQFQTMRNEGTHLTHTSAQLGNCQDWSPVQLYASVMFVTGPLQQLHPAPLQTHF